MHTVFKAQKAAFEGERHRTLEDRLIQRYLAILDRFRDDRQDRHLALLAALRLVREIYPRGMHVTIAEALEQQGGFTTTTATLDEPEHGLTQERLDQTDVLFWWGHCAHDKVQDAIVQRVREYARHGDAVDPRFSAR